MNFSYFMLMPVDTSVPVVTGLYPDGLYFFEGTNKLAFSMSSSDGISTKGIILTINGTSATGVNFSGSSALWHVNWPYLQPNSNYTAAISITSLAGNNISETISFDTYPASVYQWEAADYDYTSTNNPTVPGGHFDTGVDRYAGLDATSGIDELEVTGGTPIADDLYRFDPNGVILITTQTGGDKNRVQFVTNNAAAWRINYFGYGDFANYMRHYPAGKYNVLVRYTQGGAATAATLWQVTSGYKTANQTTSFLGTFPMGDLAGWNSWVWSTLVDSNNVPVTVSFVGTNITTLQLQGPVTDDGQTSNEGFFMLLPVAQAAATLTATRQGSSIQLSFSTATGASYQVQYTSSLVSPITWSNLGSALAGNNAAQSVADTIGAGPRFYRVEAQ
jgi:hypothetical protein